MVVLMLFVLFVTASVRINADANCQIYSDTISGKLMQISILDNATGVIGDYKTEGYTEITIENNKYVEGKFENNKLTISLKDAFKNYEEDNSGDTFSCTMKCTCNYNPEIWTLILNIADLNEHTPEFQQKTYDIKLPMPLLPNFSLNNYMEFIAKDIDISNDRLIFSIDSPDFEFSPGTPVDPNKRKLFEAYLITKRSVNLQKNETYTITVTDVGKPPLSSTATLNIFIDKKNSIVPDPKFSEILYKANIDADNHFQLDNVISLKEYDDKVSFSIVGEYSDNFNIVNKGKSVTLEYNKPFSHDFITSKPYIYMVIQAEHKDALNPGQSVVLIDLPGLPVTTPAPTTACPPCTTVAPPTTALTTACPPCPTTTPEHCTTVTIPSTTTCPVCPTSTPEHCTTEASTTCPPPDCSTCPSTTPNTPSTTTCPACPTCPTSTPEHCTTEAKTTCPPPDCSTCPPGTTPNPPSTTTCPACPTTTPEHCTTGASTPCPPPDCSSCPPITTSATTKSTHHATTLSSSTHMTVLPNSTIPSDVTTVCPTDCSKCPTVPTMTPTESGTCPPCHCTTASPPSNHVHYEQIQKSYDIQADYTGSLDIIPAISDESEDILYDIRSDDDYVKSVVSYDSKATLKVTAKMQTGVYVFSLHATGKKSKSEAECMVSLKVDSMIECGNDTYIFAQSLLVLNVMENHEKYDLVIRNNNTYDFYITYQYPENLDWFQINSTTGNLQVSPMDRENDDFFSTYKPQAKVIIEARKDNSTKQLVANNRNKRDIQDGLEEWVLTESIDNTPSRLVVSVIIGDENDNTPVFDIESPPVVIGYPNSKLAELVAPPYLVQLKATDRDAGKNGRVSYSTNTPKFIVHPSLGFVSPGIEAFHGDKDEEFLVIATDHGDVPLSSNVTVKVKVLNENQLSVITVPNLDYSGIQEYIYNLRKTTGVAINYLTATVLPSPEKKSKSLWNPQKSESTLRLVVYALDTQDKPINSNNLNKIITDKTTNLNPKEWKEDSKHCDDSNSVGWIVAVSVLSVLLVCAVIAIIILYIKYIRPRKDVLLTTMPTESLSNDNNNTFEKNRKSLGLQQAPVEEKLKEVQERRATGFIPSYKQNDDEESEESKEEKEETESVASDNSEAERKRSIVKFHPDVTEIEIEKL